MPTALGSPLYAGVVDMEKVQSGCLVACLPLMSSYATSNSVAYVEAFRFGRIYVPADAKTLTLSGKAKSSSAAGRSYMRLDVGALSSPGVYVAGVSFAWIEDDLDVSSLSGWQQIKIMQATNNASYTATLTDVSVVWKY